MVHNVDMTTYAEILGALVSSYAVWLLFNFDPTRNFQLLKYFVFLDVQFR